MRPTCQGCGRRLRVDENETLLQETALDGSTRSYLGCTNCFRRLNGLPAIGPKTYDADPSIPPDSYVCGICREAFHQEDFHNAAVRLLPEDVHDGETDGMGRPLVPEGQPNAQYVACQPCIDKFRPRIAARLDRPVESVVGGWLQ